MAMQGQPLPPPPMPPKPPTPPASAGVTTSVSSCARDELTQMDFLEHYEDSFDSSMSFMRSIKVFVMSYIGYDQLCPQLYRQKLKEYVQEMAELYDMPQLPNKTMKIINNWLAAESYHIVFDVVEFTHRPGVQSARIRYFSQMFGIMNINLKPRVSRQKQKQISFLLTSAQLRDFRVNNVVITITLELILTGQKTSIIAGTFKFEFGRVHAEGFYDWIKFGTEDQILLNFGIECPKEQIFTPNWIANYHMHSLLYAVYKRLLRWRASDSRPLHQSFAGISNAVLYRNFVDPNSEAAFWPSHPAGTGHVLHRVRFMDLQMGVRNTDYLTDSGCNCSEWCNWMAFFNYNPIYRFLFIRHSQTYLQSKANKPEMYMYAVAMHLCDLRDNLTNDMPTPETPLLRLMYDAIDYKERFRSELFLKDPLFQQLYPTSYPEPYSVSGATYIILRTEIPLFDLCYQSDTQPFGENCVDNLIQYCENLSKLHLSIAPAFVDLISIKNWRKEIEEVLRNIYKEFLPFCCIYTFTQRIAGTDRLLDTKTFGNISAYLRTNAYVRKCREQAVQIGSNPLNSPVKCQPVINSVVGCHRLIRRYEETIGKAVTKDGIESTCDCYANVDKYLTQQIQQIHCDFYVDQHWLTNQNIQDLYIPFTVCYTLKLYAISHNLQRYFTEYMFNKKDAPFDSLNDFELIFDNQMVEQTLNSIHNIKLFDFNDNMSTAVAGFYMQYWGTAIHRAQNQPDSNYCLTSALYEYKRTYFWWRNGGDQRFRFAQILATFDNTINEVLVVAERVFQDYILTTVLRVQSDFDYTAEVLDYLVYYLVKAICYTILRTANQMHKKMNELAVKPLIDKHRMYALTRPGWTPIFRTLRSALATLEAVGQKYALYDDETDRIADTITETQLMVRNLYDKHYTALAKQFYEEIDDLYSLSSKRISSPFRPQFAVIHMANGFGFLAAFINDFRKSYQYIYKRLNKEVLNQRTVIPANIPWSSFLQRSGPIIQQYLNNPDAIQSAQPLLHPIWQTNLAKLIPEFNSGTELTMNIDLAAADI